MAEYAELYIDQGTDFNTTISLNDDDTNLPQSLAGYNVASQLRRSMLAVNAAASFQCSISDASNGEITIAMTAANTANLKAGTYYYDIRLVDGYSGGTKSRLVEGVVYVTPAITK
jgi:hypothetical protein